MTFRPWWVTGNTSLWNLDGQPLIAMADVKSEEIPDIVEFARQRLGFDPNPLQELALRGGRRGIVNCTRLKSSKKSKRS